MNPNPLLAGIESAFANIARPPDHDLFQFGSEGALDVFRGRRWLDVADPELDHHSCALRFLSAAGFAHYLPAFMCAALRNPSSGLADAVIGMLTPPGDDPRRPSFAARWSRFDTAQKQAVIAFLRHHADDCGARSAASILEDHAS